MRIQAVGIVLLYVTQSKSNKINGNRKQNSKREFLIQNTFRILFTFGFRFVLIPYSYSLKQLYFNPYLKLAQIKFTVK